MGRKRREYSYDEWKKAMDLHKYFKLGYRRISRILGIEEGTIGGWLYHDVIPPAAKWVAEPSNELGYAVGTVQGDGSVCKSESKNKPGFEYEIKLATIDPEFAITFSRAVAKILNKRYIEPRWDEKRKVWRVKYQSKAFYE